VGGFKRRVQEGGFTDTARGRTGFLGSARTHGGEILCPPHMQKSNCSTRLEWTDLRVHAAKASTPRKHIFCDTILIAPHTFSFSLMHLGKQCVFFPLQVKNKPHDEVCKCARM
jgi:hypothetical protein